GSYAFQKSRVDVAWGSLLGGLGTRAFSVLSQVCLEASRKREHVRVRGGGVLAALEKSGSSWSRFFRALRLGLGNRYDDPKVAEALRLFRGVSFRRKKLPELYELAKELVRIFGNEVCLLDTLGQDQCVSPGEHDTIIEVDGLNPEELQERIREALKPKGGKSGPLVINVAEDEHFDPISVVLPVRSRPNLRREYARAVARPARRMREYFERLGQTHVPARHRMRGRSVDRSRLVHTVVRGDPRMLISRETAQSTDLFIGLVVDCSGSMASGESMEKAKLFASLLAESVRGVRGIDLRIFGFTDAVIFDAGTADRCAVDGLEAEGGNNDAAGLWHAAQVAQASQRSTKLLVMISDGLPTECSTNALSALVRSLHRRYRIHCAQIAVRPLHTQCFPHYVEILEGEETNAAVRRFGETIVRLTRTAK
ncbi:MAG: hypothetical protein AAF517_05285, partial [Planctomycetota bacterium]